MEARVEARINKELDRLVHAAGRLGRIVKKPEVRFMKSTRTAGHADRRGTYLALSIPFLEQFEDQQCTDTLGHEFVHCLIGQHPDLDNDWGRVFGKKKKLHHGPTFKLWCDKLGVANERCHTMELEGRAAARKARSRKTVEAHCGTCVHMITPNKARKILNGDGYVCKASGRQLVVSTIAQPMAAKQSQASIPRGSTKKEISFDIYNEYLGTPDRQTVIARYMDELGMSKAGASTYYANAKKRFGG